ncbi:MAG: TIGR02588 family protein [Sphingomonadales bacterium]|nr:MAG: TIGR02588 family protein [Sphingomonadales bacterium]
MAKAREQVSSTPALEWTAAAIGLAMILFVGGVIGREAITAEQAQLPAIEVTALGVTSGPTGFVLEFEAKNLTSGTAAAVAIEGKAGDETSTATLDYVAGNASAKGGLFFARDPRGAPVELRALGFQTP